jgi:hypothetical protein
VVTPEVLSPSVCPEALLAALVDRKIPFRREGVEDPVPGGVSEFVIVDCGATEDRALELTRLLLLEVFGCSITDPIEARLQGVSVDDELVLSEKIQSAKWESAPRRPCRHLATRARLTTVIWFSRAPGPVPSGPASVPARLVIGSRPGLIQQGGRSAPPANAM